MNTAFNFDTDMFSPTWGEQHDDHDDYINPGLFAKELADFLIAGLQDQGYQIKFRCAEDWGNWIELDHDGTFTLAVGCANVDASPTGSVEHRVFLSPDKPYIRKLLRKIDVSETVTVLGDTVEYILSMEPRITGLKIEERQ